MQKIKLSANTKVTGDMLNTITNMVDEKYSWGKAVVVRDIVAFLLDKFDLAIHRTSVGRVMHLLGLICGSIKNAKRTHASYQISSIRKFLIDIDK